MSHLFPPSLNRSLIRAFMHASFLLGLCGPCVARAAEQQLPSFEQVRAAYIASDAMLFDRHGEPLADLRLDPQARRLPWVSLMTLSPAMREALLAAEDKRFFEHSGIDWKAFLGAAWQNIWGRSKRGASTLTMQLAGLLEPQLAMPARGTARRSITQKWDQGLAAIELEHHWSKPQILEAYLNLAPFRGDLVGVGAASQLLFNVAPPAITRREAVILAALLRGPNARPAVVSRRACVLAEVLRDRKLCTAVTQLASSRLDAPRNQPRFALAPHLARASLRQPGAQITSTLDAAMQRDVLAALSRDKQRDLAALVIDDTSGEIRAWVGNTQNDGPDLLLAKMPLAYWWIPHAINLALEARSHTAASLLVAPPHGVPGSSLRLAVQQRDWLALRSMQQELPARPLSDPLRARLRELGFDAAVVPDSVNADVSPLLLANAWHALATSNYLPARGLPLSVPASRVGSTDASFVTMDLLTDPAATSAGWHTSWASASGDGQTQLLIGNTDRFTILVLAQRKQSPDALARSVQQLWRTLGAVVQKEESHAPQPPESLQSNIVVFEPPAEPARREWFLRGTAIEQVMSDAMPQGARLHVPLNHRAYQLGKVVQPWLLQASIARATRWQMDGTVIGQGASLRWTPSLGTHELVLLGPRDEVMDVAEFEVVASP